MSAYGAADIGALARVSTAEGGYDMDRFPSMRDWLAGVKGQPG
jgi:hypothetical protein